MTNIQILQIIGITYLLLGLGILINSKHYLKAFRDLIDNDSGTFFYGFMGLVIGYLLVTFTGNTDGWFIIIPIFGWLGLIKGALYLLAPKMLLNFGKAFTKKKEYLMFMGMFVTIFGIILSYVSFFVL
jgi:hypothetical protein